MASQIDRAVEGDKASILKVIAVNIIESRKKVGLTQEKLAHKAGIDRSYMGYIENAKHNVSVGMLERIAIALETTVSYLTTDHSSN